MVKPSRFIILIVAMLALITNRARRQLNGMSYDRDICYLSPMSNVPMCHKPFKHAAAVASLRARGYLHERYNSSERYFTIANTTIMAIKY